MRGKARLCNASGKLRLVGGGIFSASCSPRASPASVSRIVPLLLQLSGSLTAGGAASSAALPKSCHEPSPLPWVSASPNPLRGFLVSGHRWGCICVLAPKICSVFNGTYIFGVCNICIFGIWLRPFFRASQCELFHKCWLKRGWYFLSDLISLDVHAKESPGNGTLPGVAVDASTQPLFSILPVSTWSPLLLLRPLPTPWWCQILTQCINPSLSAFQALPWAWERSYSTPKAVVSARERVSVEKIPFSGERPPPFHGMPPFSLLELLQYVEACCKADDAN